MTHAINQKFPNIYPMDYFNLYQDHYHHGLQYHWILLLIYQYLSHNLIQFLLWLTELLRWHILFHAQRISWEKKLQKKIWKNIYNYHGLPNGITSDRGPQFIFKF